MGVGAMKYGNLKTDGPTRLDEIREMGSWLGPSYLDCIKQTDYGVSNLWNLLHNSFDLSYL